MLGLITLTLIPLSHSLPRVLELPVTINSLTVLCYPLSPLVFIFINYPVFGICFQHSTSLFSITLCIKLKKSCLILEHFNSDNPCIYHFMCPCNKCMSCHFYDFCVFGFIHSFTLACNSCLVACPSGSFSVFISLFLSSFLLLL